MASNGAEGGWVRVAAFMGFEGDVQADLLVTTLCGLGIEAIRVPELPITVVSWMAGVPGGYPVVVLVPPECEEEALRVVHEQTLPGATEDG